MEDGREEDEGGSNKKAPPDPDKIKKYIMQLKQKIKKLETENEELKAQKQSEGNDGKNERESDDEWAQKEAQLKDFADQLQMKENEIAAAKDKIHHLEKKFESMDNKATQLMQELSERDQTIAQLQIQLSALGDQSSDTAALKADLESVKQWAKMQAEEHASATLLLQQKLDDSNKASEENYSFLTKCLEEKDKLLMDAKESSRILAEEEIKLNEQIEQLKHQLHSAFGEKSLMEENFQQSLADQKQIISQLMLDHENDKGELLQKCSKLEDQLQVQSHSETAASGELQRLQEQISALTLDLQSSKDTLAETQKSFTGEKERAFALEQQVTTLSAQLAVQIEELATALSISSGEREQVVTLQDEKEKLLITVQNTAHEAQEFRNLWESVSAEKNSLAEEQANLLEQLGLLKEELERTKTESDKTASNLLSSQALEEQLASMEQQAQTMKSAFDKERDELEARASDIQQQFNSADAERERLLKERETMEETIASLKEKLAQAYEDLRNHGRAQAEVGQELVLPAAETPTEPIQATLIAAQGSTEGPASPLSKSEGYSLHTIVLVLKVQARVRAFLARKRLSKLMYEGQKNP